MPTVHVALGMPVALWTADALYAEALHLADAVSPAGGLALGDALRRIADSQILEALGRDDRALLGRGRRQDGVAVRGRVRPGRRGAWGARCPAGVRDAVRRYGRLFQYVDDLQDIGGEADAHGEADRARRRQRAAHPARRRPRRVGRRGARRACASLASAGAPIASHAAPSGRPTSPTSTDRLLDGRGAGARRAAPCIAVSVQALPRHVAVIMDGNGRWAERQGLARTDGHSQGEERLAEIVRAADALGIRWLTAYGFSTENWRRPRLEVDFILGLHKKIFGRRAGDARQQREDPLDRTRSRVQARGSPPSCGARSRSRPASPSDNTGLNFTVAFDYGGRQELVEAARPIAAEQPDRIDTTTVGRHLYAPELPPVDLMVRTSGEARISNFLLWEGVGAQLYVTPTLWPDFGAVGARTGHRVVAGPDRAPGLTGVRAARMARARIDARR